jgi:hypothetical protein
MTPNTFNGSTRFKCLWEFNIDSMYNIEEVFADERTAHLRATAPCWFRSETGVSLDSFIPWQERWSLCVFRYALCASRTCISLAALASALATPVYRVPLLRVSSYHKIWHRLMRVSALVRVCIIDVSALVRVSASYVSAHKRVSALLFTCRPHTRYCRPVYV